MAARCYMQVLITRGYLTKNSINFYGLFFKKIFSTCCVYLHIRLRIQITDVLPPPLSISRGGCRLNISGWHRGLLSVLLLLQFFPNIVSNLLPNVFRQFTEIMIFTTETRFPIVILWNYSSTFTSCVIPSDCISMHLINCFK